MLWNLWDLLNPLNKKMKTLHISSINTELQNPPEDWARQAKKVFAALTCYYIELLKSRAWTIKSCTWISDHHNSSRDPKSCCVMTQSLTAGLCVGTLWDVLHPDTLQARVVVTISFTTLPNCQLRPSMCWNHAVESQLSVMICFMFLFYVFSVLKIIYSLECESSLRLFRTRGHRGKVTKINEM